MNFSLQSCELQEIGITFMRVCFGLLFIRHGFPKLLKGPEEWLWLGQQMANLGITFAPYFWGLCAVFAELVGGMALTVGFGTRFFALLLAFAMFVATVHHIAKGDSYGYIAFPLSQMVVFITLALVGGGPYSIDKLISNRF